MKEVTLLSLDDTTMVMLFMREDSNKTKVSIKIPV